MRKRRRKAGERYDPAVHIDKRKHREITYPTGRKALNTMAGNVSMDYDMCEKPVFTDANPRPSKGLRKVGQARWIGQPKKIYAERRKKKDE